MTEHDTSTKINIYDEEFHVVLKCINRSLDSDFLDKKERETLNSFKSYLVDECF